MTATSGANAQYESGPSVDVIVRETLRAILADPAAMDEICEYRARQLNVPDMTIADVGGPCTHDPEEWVGRVEAGDPDASPHCSTATCAGCLIASQGYVQAVTNSPASQLIPFKTRTLQES